MNADLRLQCQYVVPQRKPLEKLSLHLRIKQNTAKVYNKQDEGVQLSRMKDWCHLIYFFLFYLSKRRLCNGLKMQYLNIFIEYLFEIYLKTYIRLEACLFKYLYSSYKMSKNDDFQKLLDFCTYVWHLIRDNFNCIHEIFMKFDRRINGIVS